MAYATQRELEQAKARLGSAMAKIQEKFKELHAEQQHHKKLTSEVDFCEVRLDELRKKRERLGPGNTASREEFDAAISDSQADYERLSGNRAACKSRIANVNGQIAGFESELVAANAVQTNAMPK